MNQNTAKYLQSLNFYN